VKVRSKAHGNTVPPFKETQAYVNAVVPMAQLNDVQKAETPKPPSPADVKKQQNVEAYAKANPSLWDKITRLNPALAGAAGLPRVWAHPRGAGQPHPSDAGEGPRREDRIRRHGRRCAADAGEHDEHGHPAEDWFISSRRAPSTPRRVPWLPRVPGR
jgi:hypothetical protein